ncbi:hypothetical protein AVEN_52707-1 [Araneus ventricosus]|uniref:Mos1 transposase HTH domain-containing protein n=1 Tax=Araneus ventricosus TaxID=182803 RepID=A0A4Y2EQZ3_ARAVE|nr:hypothetical protein AVEN_52707-1 [Araneus ventricosus]
MSEQKVPQSVEQRLVIKFFVEENVPPSETHHRLKQQYEEEYLLRTRVSERATCPEGSNQTATSSYRLFGNRCPFNQKPFFEKGIRMFPENLKNCVSCRGEYVEV